MMTISHKCHGFHLAPKNEQLNSKVFQFPSRIWAGMYRRCLKRRELCFAMSFPFETLKDTGKTPISRESILIFHKTEQFEIKFLVLLCIRKWSRGENFLFLSRALHYGKQFSPAIIFIARRIRAGPQHQEFLRFMFRYFSLISKTVPFAPLLEEKIWVLSKARVPPSHLFSAT